MSAEAIPTRARKIVQSEQMMGSMESMFECNLPPYLAHDLNAWKKGFEEHSHLLDCLWGELYGSINIAEINDGAITHEQAQYLRDKYLWGKDV